MLDERHFHQVRELIHQRCGLVFPPEQYGELHRHLSNAMQASQWSDPDAYYLHLLTHSLESPPWRILIQQVTIGETYFFRNNWQFKALRDVILPALIAQRRQAHDLRLRLWSAGCASGEEAYSLAMLLRELLPDLSQWNIHLLATDLNEQSLAKAELGLYGAWSFRDEMPLTLQEKYFQPQGELYALSSLIRSMVRFKRLNLIEDVYPSALTETQDLDLILCRNVTIYFDKDSTRRVARRFYDCLQAGGWLVVGHAEPLASIYSDYETHNFDHTVFYRKPSPRQAAPPLKRPALTPHLAVAAPPPPQTQDELLNTARQRLMMADFEGTRHVLGQLLELAPDHTEGLYLMAKLLADEGQHERALTLLHTLEQINPLVAHAHYLRALIHQGLAQSQEAKSALRRALYVDPDFALAHYLLGELIYTEGQVPAARRHWQNALAALKKLPPQHNLPFGDGTTVGTLMHVLEKRLGQG